jgi:hypothetical protein
MPDVETIKKIEELIHNSYAIKVGDREFSVANLHPIMYNPKPGTLTVHSLRGFCGFINNDIDKLIKGRPHLIVVNSPKSVDLISTVDDEDKKRTILVSAQVNEELDEFPFGKFMSQEEFAITFRSLFVKKEDDDFDYVLAYASKLLGSTSIEGEDDGITQKVTVRRGMSGALKDKETLKPIVRLSPYRTFREVVQPESEFLFRVRLAQNDAPTVALFEADGGAWVNDATQNIVDYIQKSVTGIPVIS